MPSIGTIKVRVGADIKDLKRGLYRATASLNKFSRSTGSIASQINNNIAIPFALASVAGVKMATDLESNFSKIENLVGITGRTLDQFKDGVKNLSTEVGKSQAELSNALFTVSSAGLRGAEAMEVLESASKASVIGLGDTNEVARALTGVMQSYGKENYNAAKATDVLTAIVREGNLEASSLAPVLGRVTGLASQMGISFEEVGASIATFTRLGVSAEESVTALRGIMTNFLNPSKEATQQIESLGLSVGDLQSKIRNDGLASTLIDLIDQYKGNEQALGKLIPNVRALSGVLGTAGAQGEAYANILDNIEASTGLVNEGFKKASETASAKFQKAIVSVQNAAIELGASMLPVATELAASIKSMADAFNSLDDQTKRNITQFGLMAVALGGSLKAVSILSSGVAGLTKTFNFFIPNVAKAGTALTSFDKVLNATKIGLLLAGISSAIYLYNKFSNAASFAEKSQEAMTSRVNDLTKAVNKEKNEVDQLFETLKDANTSIDERIIAYTKLSSISPEIVKGIRAETTELGKLEKAHKMALAAMEERSISTLDTEINKLEGSLSELESRLKAVGQGASPTTQEIQRLTEHIIDNKGHVAALGVNIESAFIPSEKMKSGTAGIKLMISDIRDEIKLFEAERKALIGDIDIDVNIASFKGGKDARTASIRKLGEEQAKQKEEEDKYAADRKKIFEDLKVSLRTSNELYKIHGDIQEKTQEKTTAYQNAIKSLIDLGYDASSESIARMVSNMNDLQAEFDKIAQQRSVIADVFSEVPTIKIKKKIEIETPDISDSIDNVTDTTDNPFKYKAEIVFEEDVKSNLANTIQDLFNALNENGAKIGQEFGNNFVNGVQVAGQALQALDGFISSIHEKRQAQLDEQYEKDRSRIESTITDEESKNSALEKLDEKYAAKQKKLNKQIAAKKKAGAIAESLINTAIAVTKALTEGAFAGPILAGIIGGLGAAQTAMIASTPLGFAEGGSVSKAVGKVMGATNAPVQSNGDHILAYLKAGEAVLNQKQIKALGGPGVLKSIGVPGFAAGGVVGPSVYSPSPSPMVSGDRKLNIHVTFDEPQIDMEKLVLSIKKIERTLSGHSAVG